VAISQSSQFGRNPVLAGPIEVVRHHRRPHVLPVRRLPAEYISPVSEPSPSALAAAAPLRFLRVRRVRRFESELRLLRPRAHHVRVNDISLRRTDQPCRVRFSILLTHILRTT
jgi:hypothetical protein